MDATSSQSETMSTVSRRLRTRAVLREFGGERDAQDRKWGTQSYPVGNAPSEITRARADHLKRVCAEAAANGSLTWWHILNEEIAEFMDEPDEDWTRQREELVQIAAVVSAIIEDRDQDYGDKIVTSRKRREAEAEAADGCRD